MRNILKKILAILAKQTIRRYKPTVIGVTGSVGKSTAKEAIFAVLNSRYWTWKNGENFNNEVGVPNAVLGIKSVADGDKLKKLRILLGLIKSLWLAFGFRQKYPKFLVLELAADRPGDIKYLTDIVRPSVGVVTAVGEVPVHVEFYASPKAVAEEKSQLISCLPASGLAVLNFDDQTVLDMKDGSKARVATFGFTEGADIRVGGISYFISESSEKIGGLAFTIYYKNSQMPARLNNIIGPHQIYGALAATVVGVKFGFSLAEIATAFEKIEFQPRRMTLMNGLKNSVVIDDSYNASPASTHAALDALKKFSESLSKLTGREIRKIAVLGDMKELGKYEIESHRAIGNLAGERVDVLITVGSAAKFIADSAANQIKKENIYSFSTAEEAAKKAEEIVKEGDVVLVKGSHSMRMDVVVKMISIK